MPLAKKAAMADFVIENTSVSKENISTKA